MGENMTNIRKLYSNVNYNFREVLNIEFKKEFGVDIETYYNFGLNQVVSERKDKELFTPEQNNWMRTFENGYTQAMEQIVE
jgi:hypothetical protein